MDEWFGAILWLAIMGGLFVWSTIPSESERYDAFAICQKINDFDACMQSKSFVSENGKYRAMNIGEWWDSTFK